MDAQEVRFSADVLSKGLGAANYVLFSLAYKQIFFKPILIFSRVLRDFTPRYVGGGIVQW